MGADWRREGREKKKIPQDPAQGTSLQAPLIVFSGNAWPRAAGGFTEPSSPGAPGSRGCPRLGAAAEANGGDWGKQSRVPSSAAAGLGRTQGSDYPGKLNSCKNCRGEIAGDVNRKLVGSQLQLRELPEALDCHSASRWDTMASHKSHHSRRLGHPTGVSLAPGAPTSTAKEPRLAGLGTERVLGWKEVTFGCAAGDTVIAVPLTTITTTNSRNSVP